RARGAAATSRGSPGCRTRCTRASACRSAPCSPRPPGRAWGRWSRPGRRQPWPGTRAGRRRPWAAWDLLVEGPIAPPADVQSIRSARADVQSIRSARADVRSVRSAGGPAERTPGPTRTATPAAALLDKRRVAAPCSYWFGGENGLVIERESDPQTRVALVAVA